MGLQRGFATVVKKMGGLIVAILLAALAIFFSSNHFMHAGFEKHIQRDLETMRQVVDDDLANLKARRLQEAVMLTQSVELDRAFRANDPLLLSAFAKHANETLKASFATITDARGTVLARGYWEKRGDNISESSVMQQALKGTATVDVVKLRNNGLSVAAAAPVYIDGRLVGVLMFGDAFRTHAFVDEIHRTTNLEMTIFDHDVRLSTSIMRDGGRAVGTHLDNPEVFARVLQEGGVYSADAGILGKAYKTVYWPLRDNQKKILGMWFIGTEVEGVEQTITAIALSCLAATLVIAIALSFLGVMFVRAVVNPLEKKAYVDMLTGITNRAGFERAFEASLAAAPQSGTLFLIDLDNFKDINDNLGHPVGDECLIRVAHLVKEVFRDTDIVARLGGDEFIVFAPTMEDTAIIQEKAQEFLDVVQYTYKLDNGERLTVTASIGIAIYPKDGKSYTPLYRNADSALYSVKNCGRNGYAFYTEEIQ